MEPSSRHSSNTLVSSLPASVPVDAEANAVPAALDGASSPVPSPLDSDDSAQPDEGAASAVSSKEVQISNL